MHIAGADDREGKQVGFRLKEGNVRTDAVKKKRAILVAQTGQQGGKRAAAVFDVCLFCRPQQQKIFLPFAIRHAGEERGGRSSCVEFDIEPDFPARKGGGSAGAAVRKAKKDLLVFKAGFAVFSARKARRVHGEAFAQDPGNEGAALNGTHGIEYCYHGIKYSTIGEESKMTAAERAKNYFLEGHNCSQAVALAFAGEEGVSPEIVAAASLPLGGGLGRLRLTCGAVSGAAMSLGLLFAGISKDESYALVQEFVRRFTAVYGALDCRTLLEQAGVAVNDGPVSEPRTAEFYKKRPCAAIIADAARIVEEICRERGKL